MTAVVSDDSEEEEALSSKPTASTRPARGKRQPVKYFTESDEEESIVISDNDDSDFN